MARDPRLPPLIQASHGTVCSRCLLWPDLCNCVKDGAEGPGVPMLRVIVGALAGVDVNRP